MEPSSGSKADVLRGSPLTPEALAQQLFAYEAAAHQLGDEMTAVAVGIYEQLRGRLTVFLGDVGFDALWARSLYLAQRSLRAPNEPLGDHAAVLPPGLALALAGRDASETEALLLAAFTSFFRLLFSFIGQDVSLRLIYQIWPAFPFDAADESGERGKL